MEDVFRMDAERAARIAAKRTQRLRAQVPLFADQVEAVTAEEVKAAADGHADAFERCCRELQARGDAFREQVRRTVGAEELAALDRRRAILPGTPEYHADFWRRQAEILAKEKEGLHAAEEKQAGTEDRVPGDYSAIAGGSGEGVSRMVPWGPHAAR